MLLASWRSGSESASTVFTRLAVGPPAAPVKGPATAERASRLNREAWDALQDGRNGEALPKAEEALALREQILGPRDPAVAESLNVLGEVYRARGQLDDAERIHRRALALRESTLGPQHLDVAATLNNLAMLENARAAYLEAETLLKRALAIADASPPSEQRTRLRAELFESLARVYRGLGRIADAQEAQARAMLLWTQ
jgi:tetratricopeptide (TPR) repeat protein